MGGEEGCGEVVSPQDLIGSIPMAEGEVDVPIVSAGCWLAMAIARTCYPSGIFDSTGIPVRRTPWHFRLALFPESAYTGRFHVDGDQP
jgi:hypothetical protein